MIALVIFFAFASFFYVKGIQQFIKNKDFFERIKHSKYFDKSTKQTARLLQEKSIAPFFGLPIMIGMIIASFMSFKAFENISKNQNRINKLILYKFLEINMITTPHFYIIGILAITMRLLFSIFYLLLTTNVERVFNGFLSLPIMIFNDVILVISKTRVYRKHYY